MSQDQNQLNHATWECKYHVVFTPKYRKKLLFGQIRRLGQCIPRAGPAQGMPDRRRALDARSCAHVDIGSTEVFGLRGDRVSEREELDLDCVERGTQAAEFSGSQILGEGVLRFDHRAR
jgi:hypothetical protein